MSSGKTGKEKVEQYVTQLGYLLVPELKLLSQEAKKRHPQLREACDRVLVNLGMLDTNSADVPTEPTEFLRTAEEYWQPLLLAFDGKGSRITAMSLGALQKLLSHGLVLPAQVPTVVSALSKLRDPDESVQLKVLQCLMSIYSSSEFELGSAQMPAVFTIAFTLYQTRGSNAVQGTAAAAITQITLAQFYRLRHAKAAGGDGSQQHSPGGSESSGFATAKTAYLLLKDFCTLASGETGQFIKIAGEVPKIFIFDLLHTVMKDHADVMAAHPSFVTLVREDLSLVLAQSMKSAADLPCLVRMHQVITVTLQRFPLELVKQQELLISLMAAGLDQPECPAWHKVSILASWRELCENYFYLKKMFSRFDHSPKHSNLFESMCASVCGLVKKSPPAHFTFPSLQGDRITVHKLLAAKSEDEMTIRPCEPLLMAVEVLVALCKSLSKLVEIEGRPLTDAERANDVEEQTGEDLALHMLNAVWSQVLTACSVLLERSTGEELVEETLRCFKLFTHACGKAGLPNARDSFITTINRFTLPQQGTLTPKNTQVVRVLFDIANGLGGVLDSSWHILLTSFQQLNMMLGSTGDQANQSDIQLIRTLLDNIFKGTMYFEHNALLSMVNALCQLSVEAVAASEASPSNSRYTCSPYGLQRLADVSVANIERLHLFWQAVCDHLAWLVKQAQNEGLRKAAVETASQIILAYLKRYRHISGHPTSPGAVEAVEQQGKPAQQPAWSSDDSDKEQFMQMQAKVVDLLRLMRDSDKTDVRTLVLNLVFTVIERAGHELVPDSWKLILAMLASSSHSAAEVSFGFKSVELIYSDFMPLLDSTCLQSLVACVGRFSQQTAIFDKTNTNLSAIQQGLLSIADYCSSINAEVSSTHWNALFVQLRDVAGDARPEVRHSAMKTLFNALVTHGTSLPDPCWNALFWDVLLKVLDNVHSAALAAEQSGDVQPQKGFILHHSRNTPAKQWYETRCTVLEGAVRIVKVFYPVTCKNVSKFDDVLTRLAGHLANACMHSTDEVANMGLRSLQDLVVDLSCSEAAVPEHAAVLWDVAWHTWERIAETAAESGAGQAPPTSTNILTTMTEGLADMYGMSTQPKHAPLKQHTAKHASRVLPLLEKLMKSSAALDALTFPSKLQSCVIRCFEAKPIPTDNSELQAQQLQVLCSFLPLPELIRTCLEDRDQAPKMLKLGQVAITEKVLKLIRTNFCCEYLAVPVRKGATLPVLKHVQALLLTRHFTHPKFEMWKGAVEVLPDILKSALVCYQPAEPDTRTLWTTLLNMLRGYLYPCLDEQGGVDNYNQAPPKDGGDTCDEAVMCTIKEGLLVFAVRHEMPDVTREILELVKLCSRQRRRRFLADAAVRLLFDLCDASEESADHIALSLGRAAMPVVVARCSQILNQFIADDKEQGRCPMPRYRRDEVVSVLQKLAINQFIPALFDGVTDDPPDLRKTCPAAFGRRGLAVRLFPVLVQFVTASDDAVKQALSVVLQIISSELGLSACAASPKVVYPAPQPTWESAS